MVVFSRERFDYGSLISNPASTPGTIGYPHSVGNEVALSSCFPIDPKREPDPSAAQFGGCIIRYLPTSAKSDALLLFPFLLILWHDVRWRDVRWHDVRWHDVRWHDVRWHDNRAHWEWRQSTVRRTSK